MINYRINLLFLQISLYLEREANEDGAYLVMSKISSLAAHFNKGQDCEAKNFQYRWEDLKPKIKDLSLSNDYDKIAYKIEQKIEEILEPEKWDDKIEFRKNGSIEIEIAKAQNFFNLLTHSSQAGV